MKPLDSFQASRLRCSVFELSELDRPALTAPDWLGALLFFAADQSVARPELMTAPAPLLRIPMAPLNLAGDACASCELWQWDGRPGSLRHGSAHGISFAHDEELLFGAIQLEEAQFDTAAIRADGKTPLQYAAEQAYRQIFTLLDERDFPQVLRFWNYLADINGDSHGMERYRQFNIGRQDGFMRGGRGVQCGVPAASALGFRRGPLTVYFLAARRAQPLAIENPRQVSAYEYPEDYGPRSPTFSRANLVSGIAGVDPRGLLFISGTASIVGHESLHAGDAAAQTRETMTNIAAILSETRRVRPTTAYTLGELHYKIYVRHKNDLATICATLQQIVGPDAHLLFLEADICRSDLLMEIEASAGHPMHAVRPRLPLTDIRAVEP